MDAEGRWTGQKPNVDPTAELLLRGDPEHRSMSHLFYMWPYIACPALGLGAAFFHNWMNKRPPLAGIQRHIFYTLAGAAIGRWGQKMRFEQQGEKDLMYYHYICLHPEDFPPPERVKYRDYLRPWLPIR